MRVSTPKMSCRGVPYFGIRPPVNEFLDQCGSMCQCDAFFVAITAAEREAQLREIDRAMASVFARTMNNLLVNGAGRHHLSTMAVSESNGREPSLAALAEPRPAFPSRGGGRESPPSIDRARRGRRASPARARRRSRRSVEPARTWTAKSAGFPALGTTHTLAATCSRASAAPTATRAC